MDGLKDSAQLQPTVKSHLMDSTTPTKSSESAEPCYPDLKSYEKDKMRANQKLSSPLEQEIAITLQDNKSLYFQGIFDVKTDGDWIVIYKLDETRVIFASMLFFRPKIVSWYPRGSKV